MTSPKKPRILRDRMLPDNAQLRAPNKITRALRAAFTSIPGVKHVHVSKDNENDGSANAYVLAYYGWGPTLHVRRFALPILVDPLIKLDKNRPKNIDTEELLYRGRTKAYREHEDYICKVIVDSFAEHIEEQNQLAQTALSLGIKSPIWEGATIDIFDEGRLQTDQNHSNIKADKPHIGHVCIGIPNLHAMLSEYSAQEIVDTISDTIAEAYDHDAREMNTETWERDTENFSLGEVESPLGGYMFIKYSNGLCHAEHTFSKEIEDTDQEIVFGSDWIRLIGFGEVGSETVRTALVDKPLRMLVETGITQIDDLIIKSVTEEEGWTRVELDHEPKMLWEHPELRDLVTKTYN